MLRYFDAIEVSRKESAVLLPPKTNKAGAVAGRGNIGYIGTIEERGKSIKEEKTCVLYIFPWMLLSIEGRLR